ncbi:MAG: Flp pilus assembly protein CpaB [Acidobacteria bacterium]|nr:Flp pilus assembly protein CpaB [Acidobacteriota bacterium]
MNQRFLSVILFAFAISALASFGLYKVISSRIDSTKSVATVQLVGAARDLPEGTLIKAEDLKTVEWAGTPPPQAILKAEEAIGRGVTGQMFTGEPVLGSRLAMRGAGAGLAAMIPHGMRAVAVRVNDIVGVAGFVVPGMHVDLIINGTPPTGAPPGAGNMAKTLLQNLEVLSAGQNIQKDAEGKPQPVQVVNMLVTPDQAEVLSLVTNDTRIQLVLRNPMDKEEAVTSGTSMGKIYAGAMGTAKPMTPAANTAVVKRAPIAPPAPAPAKVEPPPNLVIEVITGREKREVKFPGQANPEEKK